MPQEVCGILIEQNNMINHFKRIKANLTVIKGLISILFFFICTNCIYSQNINLSNGIGDVNCKYSYGKLIKALGTPDSTYFFDPKNMNPVPKSLAYNELFYDNNLFVVRFSYFMLGKLRKTTSDPYIEIYNGSTINLNGDLISDLDSTIVVNKYGKPKSVLKNNNELIMSYSFEEKKYFSLLTFYFSSNGSINEIRIHFGKY